MNKLAVLFMVAGLLSLSCERQTDSLFREIPPGESGVKFINSLQSDPELNILNYLYFYNGGGVAVVDINQDKLPDIYLTSNQGPDRLYLNLGSLRFKDITEAAGIDNSTGWTTGVTHADVNADGNIDLYVSKVGAFGGHNLLYLNQGMNDDGIPMFREASRDFNLDLSAYGTQAAFFDYDKDGDLDLFQLNHSRHPNRNYGKGSQRQGVDPDAGDMLLQNREGRFVDVSTEAGIFQGRIGYGLGLAISDVDGNGHPDILVGNDFFENDYLYLNQGDGTFKEVISGENPLGHTSHFTMGNEIADLDNDGLPDLLSLDMLPEDLQTFKTSGTEYPYPTYQYYLQNGYSPQYMQNTLHRNLGDGNFSEIAHLSGIAASEWSWAPLAADFDNDGDKDLFISNGIKGATNDMDFINFIANEEIQRRLDKGVIEEDMEFIEKIPPKKVANYLYRNLGGMRFEKAGAEWHLPEPGFSNGAAYADLDLDGDLDLVINNVDAPATIMENRTVTEKSNHLRIAFKGPPGNPFGIGAKVVLQGKEDVQMQENYPTRGYLSAVPPTLHFGFGDHPPKSMKVFWPDGSVQELNPTPGEITVDYAAAEKQRYILWGKPIPESPLVVTSHYVDFKHQERSPLDFIRTPLAPFSYSNEGPAVTIADFNKDGRDDIFLGGAKGQPASLFLQSESERFVRDSSLVWELSSLAEDTDHIAIDLDGNGFKELVVVSGGNEAKDGAALRPRLYWNSGGTFTLDESAFEDITLNASSVTAVDLENDGDPDLLFTADAIDTDFGKSPQHYLLINDGGGSFTAAPQAYKQALENLGQITNVSWGDIDGNGFPDLVVAGHWTPVQVLYNTGKGFRKKEDTALEYSHGWWNTVALEDLDQDGKLDIIAGNWGLNTRLKASKEEPLTLYRYDFDGNGTIDPVVTYYYKGEETTLASKDELVKQMPFLNKKFLSYSEFAKADIDELFGEDALKEAQRKHAYELRSMVYLQQPDGTFKAAPLPDEAQVSSIHAIYTSDFSGDTNPDLLLAGNTYEISTQLGRIDALHGLLLQGNQDGTFHSSPKFSLGIPGAARDIGKIRIGNDSLYIVTINNGKPIFLATNHKEQ